MPEFELVSQAEAQLSSGSGRRAETLREYVGYIQQISEGQAGKLQAAEGESGLHVFRVEIIAPDGKLLPHYGSILPAENGKASGSIPMALNDPKGRWQVRARDVATNQQAIVEFRVEE